MKRQRNTAQMKEQTRNTEVQINGDPFNLRQQQQAAFSKGNSKIK